MSREDFEKYIADGPDMYELVSRHSHARLAQRASCRRA
jgi:hypothetical protein